MSDGEQTAKAETGIPQPVKWIADKFGQSALWLILFLWWLRPHADDLLKAHKETMHAIQESQAAIKSDQAIIRDEVKEVKSIVPKVDDIHRRLIREHAEANGIKPEFAHAEGTP